MKIKKNDFVELNYTGKLKDEGIIFDTTDEKIAKENNIYNQDGAYGSVIVCVGENHVIKGVDKSLVGREVSKYGIDIPSEEGFGKKDAKLVQLIQTNKFKKEGIHPVVGMHVNVDGIIGVIKSVSGGRTLIDFNHHLSGRDLHYDVEITRIVNDDYEKADALLKMRLGKKAKTKLENNELNVEFPQELPDAVKEKLTENIKGLITSIKKVEFIKPQN